MEKIDTSSFEKFFKRVRKMEQLNSKDMVILKSEAIDIASLIGQILARNYQLEKELQAKSNITDVSMDGGGF